MKRVIAAAFSLVGLVFAVGCVGAPESDGAGGGDVSEEPALEAQGCPIHTKLPICGGGESILCSIQNNCPRCYCVAY